ncbi:hypothetical protein JCM11641_000597 [Rhodosporidiobolus odoratus]
MSATNVTQMQLEGSYKSTLAHLSRILAFRARLQQAGGAQYAGTGPPKQLVNALQSEAARFDEICQAVEAKVLRAIAVLERDARAAAGLSPLPSTLPSPPALPPPTATSPAHRPEPEQVSMHDDEPLPFTLPVSTATSSMNSPAVTAPQPPAPSAQSHEPKPVELDLTLSPSPPGAEAPLPFQLPISTSSSLPTASSTAPASAPPPIPAPTAPVESASFANPNEDLDSLLSSLGMAPFAALPSSSAPTLSNPPASAPAESTALSDFSMDAISALLDDTSSAPFAGSTGVSALMDLSSLGLPATSASAPAPGVGSGNMDFSAFLNDPTSISGVGGGGLADLDFSNLAAGPGEFDLSQLGTGGTDLNDLLKDIHWLDSNGAAIRTSPSRVYLDPLTALPVCYKEDTQAPNNPPPTLLLARTPFASLGLFDQRETSTWTEMPSLVAWAAAVLATVISKVLPLPLGVIQLFVPMPALFAVLRVPFVKISTLVMTIGSILQAGVLVEQVLMDKLGNSLNSVAKSSSGPSLSSLHTQLAAAEDQLERFTSTDYPTAVSQLLDEPLALPVIPENSDISFTAADIEEWEEGSRTFRSEFERLAEKATKEWVEILSFSPDSSSPGPDNLNQLADPIFLAAVQAELQAIQVGTPTTAIYSVQEYEDDNWARLEQETAMKQQAEKAKLDEQFATFLDGMFELAGAKDAPLSKEANNDEDEPPSELHPLVSGESLDVKRPRELLDQPQIPSLPISPTNPTWRTTLRQSWDAMHDPRKGGVLGEAMGSLSSIFNGLGGEEHEEESGEGREEGKNAADDWVPKPRPLMVNHLLRSHVQQALALVNLPVSGGLGIDHVEEEQVLPTFLASIPEEHLSPIQRAVKLDQRARRLASPILSFLLGDKAPSFSPPPSVSAPTSPREVTALLRPAPFPSFLQTLEELFALPMKHMRISVSQHEMAFTVFGNRGQMQGNAKEGVGRIALEWARWKVEMLRREVQKREKESEKEEL